MARKIFVPWKTLNKKEKKTIIIKNIIFICLMAFVVLTYVFHDQIYNSADEGGIFDRVFKPTFVCEIYRHLPNVFNTIKIIFWAWTIEKVLRLLMGKTMAKTKKGITISYMLFSLLKWAILIGTVLFILHAWGADITTLVASAGILTLIIGLGAQSLITDILAGIFIVFEEVFEVGDIISFDGYRGTVTSIGIRSVEIEDAGGDLKYINNSEIKQVINKSKKSSVARCYVNVDYSYSIPEVEKVLEANLPLLKSRVKGIISGPTYKGVSQLGDSSVQILIVAGCKEKDVFQVTRDLNREVKIIFDENNITIPFPQLVIHRPDEK